MTNRRRFASLDDLDLHWTVAVDGVDHDHGSLRAEIAPGETATIVLPATTRRPRGEAHLRIEWRTRRSTGWARRGHVVAWDQFPLSPPALGPPIRRSTRPSTAVAPRVELDDHGIARITAGDRVVVDGDIRGWLWRAPIDNDGVASGWMAEVGTNRRRWWELGVDRARTELDGVSRRDGGGRSFSAAASSAPTRRRRTAPASPTPTPTSASTRRSTCRRTGTTRPASGFASGSQAGSIGWNGSAGVRSRPIPTGTSRRSSTAGRAGWRTSTTSTWSLRSTALMSTPGGSRSRPAGPRHPDRRHRLARHLLGSPTPRSRPRCRHDGGRARPPRHDRGPRRLGDARPRHQRAAPTPCRNTGSPRGLPLSWALSV
ncbi:MAG: DUF4981 domain-containing protein [Acidimicrobiales bacterium]